MKKIIYIIFLLVIIFFINLLLYFFSEGYRSMIYDLKHKNSINGKIINDNYDVNNEVLNGIKNNIKDNIIEEKNEFTEDNLKEKNKILKDKIEEEIKGDKIKDNFGTNFIEKEKTISFTKKEKINIDFIKWIFKGYLLKKQKNKNIIFNLSGEFPLDRYIEYNGNDLDLYFFINTDYEKVLEIFDVLSYEDSFKINETNTFGERSFYINSLQKDGFIRLVIEYNKYVFGLQVKKKYYDNIKSILITKLR